MLRAFGTGLIACEKRIVHRVIHRKCESIGSPLVRARMKTGCARRWDRQEDVPEDGGPSMLIVGVSLRVQSMRRDLRRPYRVRPFDTSATHNDQLPPAGSSAWKSAVGRNDSNSGIAVTKRSNWAFPPVLAVHFVTKSNGISRSNEAFPLGSEETRM